MMDQEQIAEHRAMLRREFPVERLPTIVSARGAISRSAIKTHFSARGCPNASADVAAALIKAGAEPSEALALAIFAHHVTCKYGPDVGSMENCAHALMHHATEKHARMHPNGKCAEERAARLEGRASRWGTAEMHRGATVETPHYPYRERK